MDVRDIAAVAAVAVAQPGHIGKTYTITGPAAITHAQIARAIADATGRETTFVDVPPESFAEALRGLGVPAWQVEGLVEDYAHYSRGEASQVYPTGSRSNWERSSRRSGLCPRPRASIYPIGEP